MLVLVSTVIFILLSQIRDSPNLEGCLSYTTRHWVPYFASFYDLQVYGGGIRTRLHTGYDSQQNGRSVKLLLGFSSTVIPGLSLLEVKPHLGPKTRCL
jgi:hypothetical protein